MQKALPKLCEEMKRNKQEIIKTVESFSFTVDIWTSHYTVQSYIGLTCYWLTSDFVRKMVVLHRQPISGSHSALNIQTSWQDMLKNWGIDKARCHVVVTDSAANMVKTFRDLAFDRAACFTHTIQLALKDGLLAQRVILDACAVVRSLVGHFKHSSSATDRLHDIQKQLQLPFHNLVQDVSTRWSSTHDMLERVLEQRRVLVVYETETTDSVKLPTANQWKVIEKTTVMLRQYARLTEQSCRADASISSVIPSLAALRYFLDSDEMITGMSGVNAMRAELVTALKNRFKTLNDNVLFSVATALDSRHKLRFFNAQESAAVTEHVLKCLPKPNVPLSQDESSTSPPPTKKIVAGYWDCYDLASQVNQCASQDMHEDNGKCHCKAATTISNYQYDYLL